MLAWDRQLESWVAAHRVGPLDPFFAGAHLRRRHGRAVWLVLAAVAAVALRRWQVLRLGRGRRSRRAGHRRADQVGGRHGTGRTSTRSSRSRTAARSRRATPRRASPARSFSPSFVPRYRVPLLVLAALVAISRAYVGVHYPLDVLAGRGRWATAIGAALLAVRRRATGRCRSSSGSRETP